jgi:predicted ATP-grasp superfamily ATP-dependent carboligase
MQVGTASVIPKKILLAGFTTRSLAESAHRCGANFLAIDYFGDLDQKLLAANYSLLREGNQDFTPEGLLAASTRFDFTGVVYTGNLENYPAVVRELAQNHRVLGNSWEVLEQIRDWQQVCRFLCREGIKTLDITFFPPEASPEKQWLVKPVKSGGGINIRFWSGEEELGKGYYLQEYRPGISFSVSFLANGAESVVIGLCEQLVGCRELGGEGFVYCGNILPFFLADGRQKMEEILRQVRGIVSLLTKEYSLKGLNCLDFVFHGGEICLLEVNPRYSASMELIEEACGLNLFSWHLRAVQGELPDFSLESTWGQIDFFGKAILYAGRTVTMGDTGKWLGTGIKDIPFPREVIKKGQPVCTIFSTGKTRNQCWQGLIRRGKALQEEIGT